MDDLKKPMDLQLWLNEDLIRQQNFLKEQFIGIFQEVGNALFTYDLRDLSPKPISPKLSRGNELNGLPYLVLDVIRDFHPEDGANIRLLNWFGVGCFVTLLLGKNRTNPISDLLHEGFAFGLSANQWSYPDVILNGNHTIDVSVINDAEFGFYHWIKPLKVVAEPDENIETFTIQIKKILGILELTGQQHRI
jgi:hypothetical protein